MSRTVHVLALGALLLLGACAKPRVIQKAQQDDGSTAAMHKGDKLDVALEGNPSTGFAWLIASGDTTIIAREGEVQFLPGSEVIGEPGTETLHFVARKRGKTTLRLEHRRPFENEVAPAKSYTLEVAVD